MEKLIHFFDKLEDKTRSHLSRYPLIYAFVGGVGIVLFWRGVWHLADDINMSSLSSLTLGSVILLVSGVFVSVFVGNRLIISGLKGEKKLVEKTEEEIKEEGGEIKDIQETLKKIQHDISEIKKEI